MSKTKIISVAAQKGGVGKTTTTVNLGTSLARKGKKVLLLDLDPQSNLTMCMGYPHPEKLKATIADVFNAYATDQQPPLLEELIVRSEGCDLIPASIQLAGIEILISNTLIRESIKLNGVIVPVIIRPIKGNDYEYEIISGHNRVRASTLAGLDTVPCSIKNVDDDTAVIIMIDTNLQQREIILPSEKAFAYKYKYEAIKSKGKRNDLTSSQVDTKLQNDDFLAKESNESKHTMYRYIRLTHLIPELLDKVDERKIPFIPAVDLSYLSTQEQKYLLDILTKEEHFNVTLKQAAMLKAISQKGNLTYEKINKIVRDKIYQPPSKVKISYKKIKNYFPDDITPKQLETLIIEALELWSEQKKKRKKEV